MSDYNKINFSQMSMSQAERAVKMLDAWIDNRIADNHFCEKLHCNEVVHIWEGDSDVSLNTESGQMWGFVGEDDRTLHALWEVGEVTYWEEKILESIDEVVKHLIRNDMEFDNYDSDAGRLQWLMGMLCQYHDIEEPDFSDTSSYEVVEPAIQLCLQAWEDDVCSDFIKATIEDMARKLILDNGYPLDENVAHFVYRAMEIEDNDDGEKLDLIIAAFNEGILTIGPDHEIFQWPENVAPNELKEWRDEVYAALAEEGGESWKK